MRYFTPLLYSLLLSYSSLYAISVEITISKTTNFRLISGLSSEEEALSHLVPSSSIGTCTDSKAVTYLQGANFSFSNYAGFNSPSCKLREVQENARAEQIGGTWALYIDYSVIATINVIVNCADGFEAQTDGSCSVSAPTCSDGKEWNEELQKCLAVDETDPLEDTSKIQSLEEPFYSDNQCPTSSEINNVVPNSFKLGDSSNSIVNVPECSGSYWKCDYNSGIFQKLSYSSSGEQCLLTKEDYSGVFNSPTVEDKETQAEPCDKEYKLYKDVCGESGYSGMCSSNGMFVTGNTLKCNDVDSPVVDCSSRWHEKVNGAGDGCECEDGYEVNSFGDCWKPLFPDTNSTTADQEATEALAEKENHEEKLDTIADNNATAFSQNSNQTTNDTLSGIRRDLNTTNSLLASLDNKDNNTSDGIDAVTKALNDILNGVGMELDENGDPAPSDSLNTSNITDFMNNIKDDIEDIINSFESTKQLIENPFTMDIQTKSYAPIEITMWGRTVKLDIFTYLSIIRPVMTFILTIAMYILSIKIFIKGLGLKNG
jgi:hypothetical protein